VASRAPSPTRSEGHRATQAGIVALIGRLIAEAWARLLDPHDLKGSTPKLATAVEAIVTHYGRASSAAALTFYRNERRAAGVLGRPNLTVPPPPSSEAVRAVVERALSPLYGPVTPEIEQRVQAALTSEVEQMVLDQSRTAIIDSAQTDRAAKGWARITEPGACSFCRLLATRGAVYRSEETANFRAHVMKADGSGGTCRCHAEPVFVAYEKTAQARQDTADYQRLADEFGHSGRAILIAWRQHIEGRPVTGPLTKPYKRSS
jgi:hypothetical protein